MRVATPPPRRIGLWGATGVGVGAIVGGGVLALAGVAFGAAGPSAIVAFALNGVIAVLTAMSFAEMSAAFPESGGTYTFAKKVLSIRAAFTIGWVVWFASIVAGVLYALGFAVYALRAASLLWPQTDAVPAWLQDPSSVTALAVGAVLFYALELSRKAEGGGQWATIVKVVVFTVLICGGLVALGRANPDVALRNLTPFFAGGRIGIGQAMGYTFIALQGFDLIAAVAGEVRDPTRTIPRSMLLSLAIALLIYLPLLLVITTVGVPDGKTVVSMSRDSPETVVADAARHYLGSAGFWLVMVAAVLSMLSALQANLLASSRVAQAMALDRTLPSFLEHLHGKRQTPIAAIAASSAGMVVLLLFIRDVAVAGAVSSLIFLVCFGLAHATSILARLRSGGRSFPFRTPWFPFVPIAGGLSCFALAVFQAVSVPRAGIIGMAWIALGGVIFVSFLVRRAAVFDASTEALDPGLAQLRGRSPLVLVPIANPANAAAMVAVATSLAPPRAGRVLLLNVVSVQERDGSPDHAPRQLADSQQVLGESLLASFREGLTPEALTTVAPQPWPEIVRVARLHRCASLLLGFSKLSEEMMSSNLEIVISQVNCDVSVLRAGPNWHPGQARRILVPIGGRSEHDVLRARLLGSLNRMEPRVITFLRVLPEATSAQAYDRARGALRVLARDEAPAASEEVLLRSGDAAGEIIRSSADCDLIVMGLQRLGRHQKVFGDFTLRIARETRCPLLLISRRG